MVASVSDNIKGIGIIAGRGELPRLLAEECKDNNLNYRVVTFDHLPIDWGADHPLIKVAFEQTGSLIGQLRDNQCSHVVFAGAMERFTLDQSKLDNKGIELATILSKSFKSGDDETLRSIIQFFEDNNLEVLAAHQVKQSLLPKSGIITAHQPTQNDEFDAMRAAEIVDKLGEADVGQGVVVGQGICLAVETIQGTDKMLSFVSENRGKYLPNSEGSKGLLYKAPKPMQDMRVDVPTIGPETVRSVFAAGLEGIVIESDGVMIVNQPEAIELANELGLFIWVRPKRDK